MSIILPGDFTGPKSPTQDRPPISFPFIADKNAVLDANGIPVALVSPALTREEAEKIARLFAAAPDMPGLLIAVASLLTELAKQNNLPHGTDIETEEEKEQCPICQIAQVISRIE